MKKPYKCNNLPYDIEYTDNIIRLLYEASVKYGEYKGKLDLSGIDKHYFLMSIIKKDSYKSTQIEGTSIPESELFTIEYKTETSDEYKEIINYIQAIKYGTEKIKQDGKISLELINYMHNLLLSSVRGEKKNPGEIRKIQNWIGPLGLGINDASFIPPAPEEVLDLMSNLTEYMNTSYNVPDLIALAIAHAQFETIHPYHDGNGRLGRALIPLQLAVISDDEPILFISEIIEQYKPSYERGLTNSRRGNINGFIEFFLQCVIDQCFSYSRRIEMVDNLKKKDIELMYLRIKNEKATELYNLLLEKVVITSNEISKYLDVSIQTARVYINSLIELGILKKVTNERRYVYTELFNIFVGN